MSDEDERGGEATRRGSGATSSGRSDTQSITEFAYEENREILRRKSDAVRRLNKKSANLLRLLGVLFSLFSGASLLAARLTTDSDNGITLSLILNEYIVLSLVWLAGGFLFAVLAYHRTEVARGPSATYLRDETEDFDTVESIMADINSEVPGWVTKNETEIQRDNTRLFNCKMSIFFSLCYVVIGGLFAARRPSPTTETRIALFLLVGTATYLVYDQIRDRATAEPGDGG
jgi:hypothetical protein